MAKCIVTTHDWQPKLLEFDKPDFNVDAVRLGESLIKQRLERTFPILLDIANDYNLIKASAQCDELQIDCVQVQDALVAKLENLQSIVATVAGRIVSSELIASTRHRYYIAYSYGLVEKIQLFLQSVGRLSEIDQRLYDEEQRKLLVSEESITIHSLTSIWTGVIKVLEILCDKAKSIFLDDDDELTFVGQLEFSTAHLQYTKILLMDLTITSWIRFNRLVKFDDLVEGSAFLCPCHNRLYFKTLKAISLSQSDEFVLKDMIQMILDYQSKPSMMTLSARRFGIVPAEPRYADSDPINLAYFVVWHLCSIRRIVRQDCELLVNKCSVWIESSFDVAMRLFLPSSQQQQAGDFRLSPHQEERFKLMFLMLSRWCSKCPASIGILLKLFTFLDSNWNLFGQKYFQNDTFTVEGLTLFQLFTKLFNEAMPIHPSDPRPGQTETLPPTGEEQELIEVWNKFLARIQTPNRKPTTPAEVSNA